MRTIGNIPTPEKLKIAFLTSLSCVLIFLAVSYFNMRKAATESQNVQTTLQMLQQLESVQYGLQTMETGQRGFVISGNETFLAGYTTASRRINRNITILKSLRFNNPQVTRELDHVIGLVTEKLRHTKITVEIRRVEGFPAAAARVRSGRGQVLTDSVVNSINRMQLENRKILRQSNAEREAFAARLNYFIIVASILFLAVIILGFIFLRKDILNSAAQNLRLQFTAGLLKNISDPIVTTDPGGIIRHWNNHAGDLYGYTAGEAIGRNINSLLEHRAEEQLFKSPEDHRAQTREIHQRHKSGYEILAEVKSAELKDNAGNNAGHVLVIRDITERKKLEQHLKLFGENMQQEVQTKGIELLEALNRFELVSQATNDAVWDWDMRKDVLWGNESFCRFFDLAPKQTLKFEEFLDKIHPADRRVMTDNFRETLRRKEQLLTEEFRYTDKAGNERVMYDRAYIIYNEKGRAFRMLGAMQDISADREAEEKLQRSHEAMRDLASHLEKVREDERTHMAREIHDELGQQLTGLKMDITWLNKKLQPDDPEVQEKLNDAVELIDKTVVTVRRIATELRPSILDDLGLIAAMEWQTDEFEKRSEIKADFISNVTHIAVRPDVATAVFRIFQESLTNVLRHSGATKVDSFFSADNESLTLNIRDNGRGFFAEEIEQKKTLGLLGMRERISLVNGTYEINGKADSGGTSVVITVPLR